MIRSYFFAFAVCIPLLITAMEEESLWSLPELSEAQVAHLDNVEKLEAAALTGDLETFKTLTELCKHDNEAMNRALNKAAYKGHASIIDFILKQELTLRISETMWLAAAHGHAQAVETFLKYSFDSIAEGRALLIATKNRHTGVVRILCENYVWHDKYLALHTAIFWGDLELVKALLVFKGNGNPSRECCLSAALLGKDALSMALQIANSRGLKEIAQFLQNRIEATKIKH